MQIRATHRSAFRCGEWATLVCEGEFQVPVTCVHNEQADHVSLRRVCYVVQFPDGVVDFWPKYDAACGYEFQPGRVVSVVRAR